MRAKSVVVKWTFPSESSGMFILYNNHHFAKDSSYTMPITMTTPMMNIRVLRLRRTTPYEFFVRQPVWALAAESKGRIHVLQHVVPFCHPTLRFKILSFMITLYNNKLILNTVPWRSVLKVQYCFHSFWLKIFTGLDFRDFGRCTLKTWCCWCWWKSWKNLGYIWQLRNSLTTSCPLNGIAHAAG